MPIDALNAGFGAETAPLYRTLRPLCDIPRLSTHAIAAVINQAVRRMAGGCAFVNVGVWNGFSLLSALAGNPDKLCVGIDNFSEFGGPREAFLERFERHRSPMHEFHDMDYEEYFARRHRGPIGVYLYDGDHAYDHQLRGLQVAEPFFSDECVVIVDDTNWGDPRQATLEFVAQSKRDYALLLDATTADNWHPTFWNGLMVFQATAGASSPRGAPTTRPHPAPATRPPGEPASVTPDARVSLVVCGESSSMEATIEQARGQTWPHVEVVSASPREGAGEALRAALSASTGDFVAFADAFSDLDEAAVEMGLALPRLVRFDQGALREGRGARLRRALEAGREIDAVLPPGAPFVFIGDRPLLAQTIRAGPPLPLVARDEDKDSLDDAAALARLAQLQADGAGFTVILWTAFEWLSERPELQRRLRSEGRCLVENERVLVGGLG